MMFKINPYRPGAGLMPTYLAGRDEDIYNVLLLPGLIDHIFEQKSAQLVKGVCIVAYFIFFYYQMVITWNLPYESDILNLFIY